MASAAVTFKPVGHDGMTCEVRAPSGRALRLSGTRTTVEPEVDGDDEMRNNRALVHNAWAYAKHEKESRVLQNPEKKASHHKQGKAHAETATKIAELVDELGHSTRSGWCSSCFTNSEHRRVKKGRTTVPVYLCVTCGSPTLKCAAPRCDNMATRGFGSLRVPRFCAEHRHEIPSFEHSADKVARLEDYKELHEFDKRNLTRGSRLALAGVLAAGIASTGGLMAAPAVGGAVGSLVGGYTGAAASSYGLALLGGGSIAAGGFGMVGGTYVVVAVGAALGSALGASVTYAYVSEDKSFRIEKFRDGTGTPVIVTRGFNTESDKDWIAAMALVERRYPDSPVYKLYWGSKELKSLGAFAARNVGAKQAMGAFAGAAARAGKVAAKKLGPVAPALFAADLAKTLGIPRRIAPTRPVSRLLASSPGPRSTRTSWSATASVRAR